VVNVSVVTSLCYKFLCCSICTGKVLKCYCESVTAASKYHTVRLEKAIGKEGKKLHLVVRLIS